MTLYPLRRGATGAHPPRSLVLVSIDWTRPKDPRVPLGHASLLAALCDAGVAVTPGSFAVTDPGFSTDRVIAWVLDQVAGDPGRDLGIGAYIWNEPYIQTILPELRRRGFRGRIILGGPQISYQSHGLEKFYPDADVFVRGYGERALIAIMQTRGEPVIEGVHWAGGPDRASIARPDLATLPSPFLDGHIALTPDRRFIRWESKRGCPYRCSFCQHREPGARLKARDLGLPRLRDEIALFAGSQVDDIAVLDPVFNMGRDYLAVLDEFHRVGYRGRLSLQCRFEALDTGFLRISQPLDARLEFGLQTIHPEEGRAIQRMTKPAVVDRAITQLHAHDQRFEVSLIYGLPNQTLASFHETVDACLRWRIPVIRAFPLMLLRGTELERDRERWGLVENDELIPAVVASHSFDRDDWRQMAATATLLDAHAGDYPGRIAELLAR